MFIRFLVYNKKLSNNVYTNCYYRVYMRDIMYINNTSRIDKLVNNI